MALNLSWDNYLSHLKENPRSTAALGPSLVIPNTDEGLVDSKLSRDPTRIGPTSFNDQVTHDLI